MKVKTASEAWTEAARIFPTDWQKDEESSARAGYPIYRSTAEGHYYDYICDLNDRLEVNLSTGKTVNIWIEGEPEQEISPEKMEKLKSTAIRIQRLGFFFAGEMLDEEEKGEKNKLAFEKEAAENPGKKMAFIDVSANNVSCMKECFKSCRKSYRYLGTHKADIEDWQLAGINAMFDQVNESKVVPYDLPYAIEGILLILEDGNK